MNRRYSLNIVRRKCICPEIPKTPRCHALRSLSVTRFHFSLSSAASSWWSSDSFRYIPQHCAHRLGAVASPNNVALVSQFTDSPTNRSNVIPRLEAPSLLVERPSSQDAAHGARFHLLQFAAALQDFVHRRCDFGNTCRFFPDLVRNASSASMTAECSSFWDWYEADDIAPLGARMSCPGSTPSPATEAPRQRTISHAALMVSRRSTPESLRV